MPKGYPNPKPEIAADAPDYDAYAPRNPNPPPAPSVDAVLLKRHYCPKGEFGVVGHTKPAVVRKVAGGGEVEVEPEAFIKDSMAPAPFPGAAIGGKVWAGTTISLPIDEAKAIVRAGIAERAWAD